MSEFNQKGDVLLERLRSMADGKTMVKLFNEINHAALDVIASVTKITLNVYKIILIHYFLYLRLPLEWMLIASMTQKIN